MEQAGSNQTQEECTMEETTTAIPAFMYAYVKSIESDSK